MTKRSRSWAWALVLLAASATAGAPAADATLAGYHYETHVLNDVDDATSSSLPIVVALHWSGSSPAEFRAYFSKVRSPVRLVLLRGHNPRRNGYSFFPVKPYFYDLPEAQRRQIVIAESDKLVAFLHALARRHPDAPRPILVDASQGGDLAYAVAVRHPETIRKAVPMLATIDPALVSPRSAASVPIVFLHGDADATVPIASVRAGAEALRRRGVQVRVREYAGVGHDLPEAMQVTLATEIDPIEIP